jgi:hypothetical protein
MGWTVDSTRIGYVIQDLLDPKLNMGLSQSRVTQA